MVSHQTSGWIVVGVDGSEHSRRALRWALDEAKLRGVGCLLIHAWNYGLVGASPWPGEAAQTLADDARVLLERDVAFACSSGVPVEARLEYGSAAQVLTNASKGALLLVVGNRGRGGLTGALLGSVSSACVHHACCPVVVITPADRVPPQPVASGAW
jgi:nucleotide-binding universal stress UspA family protein